MDDTASRLNFDLVHILGQRLQRGGHALKEIPESVVTVVARQAWKHYLTDGGKVYEHQNFKQFVERPPFEGLGSSVRQLQQICKDHKDALDAIDRAMQRPSGNPHVTLDNIQDYKAPTGTSEAAAIRRLRKDHPELHAQVIAGELSAHAAAIAAGFRKPTVTIPLTVTGFVNAIRRHCTDEQRRAIHDATK